MKPGAPSSPPRTEEAEAAASASAAAFVKRASDTSGVAKRASDTCGIGKRGSDVSSTSTVGVSGGGGLRRNNSTAQFGGGSAWREAGAASAAAAAAAAGGGGGSDAAAAAAKMQRDILRAAGESSPSSSSSIGSGGSGAGSKSGIFTLDLSQHAKSMLSGDRGMLSDGGSNGSGNSGGGSGGRGGGSGNLGGAGLGLGDSLSDGFGSVSERHSSSSSGGGDRRHRGASSSGSNSGSNSGRSKALSSLTNKSSSTPITSSGEDGTSRFKGIIRPAEYLFGSKKKKSSSSHTAVASSGSSGVAKGSARARAERSPSFVGRSNFFAVMDAQDAVERRKSALPSQAAAQERRNSNPNSGDEDEAASRGSSNCSGGKNAKSTEYDNAKKGMRGRWRRTSFARRVCVAAVAVAGVVCLTIGLALPDSPPAVAAKAAVSDAGEALKTLVRGEKEYVLGNGQQEGEAAATSGDNEGNRELDDTLISNNSTNAAAIAVEGNREMEETNVGASLRGGGGHRPHMVGKDGFDPTGNAP